MPIKKEPRDEVDQLISELQRMANQLDCKFTPDPERVKIFREFHRRRSIQQLKRSDDAN
jgi:hypothetical protein